MMARVTQKGYTVLKEHYKKLFVYFSTRYLNGYENYSGVVLEFLLLCRWKKMYPAVISFTLYKHRVIKYSLNYFLASNPFVV